MKRKETVDCYFDKQPPCGFISLLRSPLHTSKPPVWNDREKEPDEVYCPVSELVCEFPDTEGLLSAAYADFRLFLSIHSGKACGAETPFRIRTVCEKTECFEDHVIRVNENECVIAASDTEGIRRGLVYVEDEMLRRSGCFLGLGETRRHAYLKTRISRSFFSPINRPPRNIDELYDDVDYYPEEYLNRLSHDGVNGVWIYTKFRELLPSAIRTEYDKNYGKRIEKLKSLCDKCRLYGIKPYVFAIEPAELDIEEAEGKYKDMKGATRPGGKHFHFCTNTERGREYCIEATKTLFTLCPDIGGMILITHGERGTACGSSAMVIDCPRCKDKKIGDVLSQTVDCLMEGLRQSGAKGEFISWSYGHRIWSLDAVRDYVRSAPSDVMLMQNFEEMGMREQLGKERLALDYWLSYPGPSELFSETAKEAARCGKHIYAKTQVCCSHEVASVPYVPAPGLLWEKYREMRKLGVEGVMQCWYFGNYPSLMSKAAGELAFEGEFADKDAFLKRLCGIYWGKEMCEKVLPAWRLFEEGYRNYPTNIMFSYFGPVHDGPVWKLQLLPKNYTLPRTWQTCDIPDGDRIYECLLCGHSLPEAIELCRMMHEKWHEGTTLLPKKSGYYLQDEQLSVAGALDIQFAGALSILRFYDLRDKLGKSETKDEARALLSEMRKLVLSEKENSRRLSLLCENDPRLGYHSEGEGYKYFPEKLEKRIEALDELLCTEFPAVEERIEAGLPPLEYYLGIEEDSEKYELYHGDISHAEWRSMDKDGAAFRASITDKELYLEMRDKVRGSFGISTEFRLLRPDAHLTIDENGVPDISFYDSIYYQAFGKKKEEELKRWHVTVRDSEGSYLSARLLLSDILRGEKLLPMKIKIVAPSGASLCGNRPPIGALGKADMNPEDYLWLIP